jgi:deoxycytidylate deaminase
MLINSGVIRICYEDGYPDELGSDMIKEAGIELVKKESP